MIQLAIVIILIKEMIRVKVAITRERPHFSRNLTAGFSAIDTIIPAIKITRTIRKMVISQIVMRSPKISAATESGVNFSSP